MKQVSRVHFDTAELPPAKRFPTWASALPHYDLSLPPSTPPESFHCEATAWFLGDLILTRAALPEVHWLRAPARIRADGVNTYNFLLLSRGTWIGTAGGREFIIGAGQLGCFDLAQPSAGSSSPSDSLAITCARPTIDRLARTAPDLHGRVLSGPASMLLIDYLLALERQLPFLEQNDVPAMARAVLAQFAATIEIAVPSSGNLLVDSVRHNARQHIERHLSERTMTPAKLTEDLGVTRSMLYRSFEPLGGIAAYIQRRRLEIARVLLSDANEMRSIAELAEDLGFADASHFAAAFRRAYGVTPRELRRRAGSVATQESDACGPTALFRRWTSKLQGRSV